jgi:nucleoside-diphosphate-sugar epimerase
MNRSVDHVSEPLVGPGMVQAWIERLPQPVAITGGTGFVGSHLVDTLVAAGVTPRVLVRDLEAPRWIGGRDVVWVEGSLEDAGSLRRLVEGAGTVVHLAGITTAVRADDFDRGNRLGTASVVNAVAATTPGARLVHISSLAAAGPAADPKGLPPDVEARPVSDYGASKLGAEQELRRLAGDRWWAILRPPAIYGPRDTDVFEFFRMANTGVALVPAGERWISVAYVADVIRAILAAAVGESHQVYHVGEPDPYRMDELLRILADAGGVRARLARIPPLAVTIAAAAAGGLRRLGIRAGALTPDKAREILARHWTASTAASLDQLGIDNPVPFADGAAETWAWYRGQGWLR